MKSLLVALAFVLTFSAAEAGNGWTIQRSSGQVSIASSGKQAISPAGAGELQRGATVTTGANGRVLLVRGEETMTVGPNSVVTLPGNNIFGFTSVLQRAGEVTFDVEKKNVRHFAVKTPFLAAVVKGTRFTILVADRGASVSVSRGLVGVKNLSGGQRNDIGAGQTATVAKGDSETMLSRTNARQALARLLKVTSENRSGGVGKMDSGKPAASNRGGNSGKSNSGSGGNNGNSGNGNGNGNSGNGNGGG